MGSQEARVLEILGDNRWHCGNEFLAAHMPRYSAVIHTLRHQRGYTIGGEPCSLHGTEGHRVFMFRILTWPHTASRGEQTSWLE